MDVHLLHIVYPGHLQTILIFWLFSAGFAKIKVFVVSQTKVPGLMYTPHFSSSYVDIHSRRGDITESET